MPGCQRPGGHVGNQALLFPPPIVREAWGRKVGDSRGSPRVGHRSLQARSREQPGPSPVLAQGFRRGLNLLPPLFCCIRAEHGVQKRCFSASLKLKPSSRRLQHRRDVCNTMKMKRLDRSWPVLKAIAMPVSPVFGLCLLPILITIERSRRTRFRAHRP